MAYLQTSHTNIRSIAAAVPVKVINNIEYDQVPLAEREMFIKTTGIAQRRMAGPGLCTSDLCFAAAEKIIADLDIDKGEIDILVFVSQSPDYLFPATSVILQDRLGLGKHVMAFDINLGCSGYVYGLSVITSLMQSGAFRKGLLMAGDISTHAQNYKDKSAYPLFGDAGTVTLMEYTPENTTMSFSLNSDGSGYQAIIKPDGALRSPFTPESYIEKEYENGIIRSRNNIHMNGLDVFNFSTREVPADIKGLLEYCGLAIDQVDYFVFHQANKLMNETIRKKLKIDAGKVPYSLDVYGNTSSASVPLTIVHVLSSQVAGHARLCLSGFGVGLSWANAIVDLKGVYSPAVIEV